MAIVFWERIDSRPVDLSESSQLQTWTYNAIADDDEDETDVYAAILTDLDEEKNGLVRQRIRIDPIPGREDRWTVTLEFGPEGQDGTGDAAGAEPSDPAEVTGSEPGSEGATPSELPLGPGYTFDISAETTHITQSRRTFGPIISTGSADLSGSALALEGADNQVDPDPLVVSAAHVGRTVWITAAPSGWTLGGYTITAVDVGTNRWTLDRAPAVSGSGSAVTWSVYPMSDNDDRPNKFNYKGAIGYNGDRIDGCDIITPKMSWTRTISKASASMAYFYGLMDLVGCKNAAPFYGAKAGEALFAGASGTYSLADRYSVTHRFDIQRNKASIALVPGELTVPYKRGWDYLWVRYSTKIEDGAVAPKAAAAFVEEVYPDGDFSEIGIGV